MNLGATGKKGEALVVTFLQSRGYSILKRNYICRFGEIDIIARKGEELIFIEVKTRAENALVKAAEAVDSRKQKRIILTAQDYIVKTETELQPRFDVAEVTVYKRADGNVGYKLNYIKNAF